MMLTLQECLDFCELTEDEIHTIAEHERLPEIVAAERGSCLLETREGVCLIKRYLVEDIVNAELHHQLGKATRLHQAFDHFNVTHPTSSLEVPQLSSRPVPMGER